MSEWISVKDRLPEEGIRVLAQQKNPCMVIARITDCGFGLRWYRDGDCPTAQEVTHWMPLPPPPEPQLTVKEALAKAIAYIELCGRIGPITDKLTADPLLPRLRAALEAE